MSAQAVSGILAAAILGCSIAALAVPEALSQGTIEGLAWVVDGDTIWVCGPDAVVSDRSEGVYHPMCHPATKVRIAGIDAPEMHQMCGVVHCGLFAKQMLVDAIAGATVRCTSEGTDKYGRTLATCSTASVRDLGAHMVGSGGAVSYRRYGDRYRDAEDAAKAERLGIWRTDFVNPEDWRRGKR